MSAKLLIRISAFLVFIHLLGHSLGHLNWDKPKDQGMIEVIDVMKNYSAAFMGSTKSMADYYNGYSLILFGLFGLSIALLWILSNDTIKNPKMVRQLLYPIGLVYLFFGVIEFLYFFPFAASISTLVGISSLLSITKLETNK